jgi:hypothetical protein
MFDICIPKFGVGVGPGGGVRGGLNVASNGSRTHTHTHALSLKVHCKGCFQRPCAKPCTSTAYEADACSSLTTLAVCCCKLANPKRHHAESGVCISRTFYLLQLLCATWCPPCSDAAAQHLAACLCKKSPSYPAAICIMLWGLGAQRSDETSTERPLWAAIPQPRPRQRHALRALH